MEIMVWENSHRILTPAPSPHTRRSSSCVARSLPLHPAPVLSMNCFTSSFFLGNRTVSCDDSEPCTGTAASPDLCGGGVCVPGGKCSAFGGWAGGKVQGM